MANEDVTDVIGFLGSDGSLYCSRACAAVHGVPVGNDVDQDEYDALVESESVRALALCPGCGTEYPFSWPEREVN